MRLCMLESSYEGLSSDFAAYDTWGDIADLSAGHELERHSLVKATAVDVVRQLASRDFDVFVNFCDGARDEERAGAEVVLELERLGVPFTGPASPFYEPSRQAMKDACRAAGIDAPRGVHLGAAAELGRADPLGYPLIVKHPASYGSIGLTAASKVWTPAAREEQARRMIERFGGALVEEFIEGREFTVLVAEALDDGPPLAFRTAEFRFLGEDDFNHFDLKWVRAGALPVPCLDEALDARLRDLSGRFFTAMGGTGHARCDMRMDRAGRVYMLEINPNSGLFGPDATTSESSVILANDPRGRRGFIDHILRCAFKRRRARAPLVLA